MMNDTAQSPLVLHLDGPPLPTNLEFKRTDEAARVAAECLGAAGRMLSHSKSFYYERHRGNHVAFNANVFSRRLGKLWWGDLDLTLDGPKLQALADRLGEEVVVLYEMDGRFERATDPAWDHAAATYMPRGSTGDADDDTPSGAAR